MKGKKKRAGGQKCAYGSRQEICPGDGVGRERLEPRNNLDVKRTHHELPHVHYIDVNILCIYMLY